jgi:hypothetical protein
MIFGDEEETGQLAPDAVPATEADSAARRVSTKNGAAPPVFHPLAYRGVVAGWPVEWRERWGRRANVLEENGLSWRDAEAQAFVEIWTEIRSQPPADSASSTLESSNAARN